MTNPVMRPDALDAWRALSDVLAWMDDRGRRPVCESQPDQWSGDASIASREAAATACRYCPAVAECLSFAQVNREPQGVWGGRDLTPRGRRSASEAAA